MRNGDFLFLLISLIAFCSVRLGGSVGCWFPSKIVNTAPGRRFWGITVHLGEREVVQLPTYSCLM